MKADVLSLNGEKIEEIELPSVFEEVYRPDLIRRVVLAFQANRRQPYGASPLAGKQTSASCWGVGYGRARVPRLPDGTARLAPMARGGRRAHPPKAEKKWEKKVNRKERRLALRSAIAATCNEELVRKRGHKFSASLPIVVEDKIEALGKTKEVENVFRAIGVYEDLERAMNRKVRAGRGKMRGRKYKRRKSVLIVIREDRGISKAASNLQGVDVVRVNELNVEHLAPGTHPGRLVVYTKGAIEWLRANG